MDAYPEGASPYGVYDMIGNCSEWTMSVKVAVRQWVIARGEYAVRGGCIPDNFRVTKCSNGGMGIGLQESRLMYVGFRPVLDEWGYEIWMNKQRNEGG